MLNQETNLKLRNVPCTFNCINNCGKCNDVDKCFKKNETWLTKWNGKSYLGFLNLHWCIKCQTKICVGGKIGEWMDEQMEWWEDRWIDG